MPRTSAGVSEVYRLHHICPSLPAFLVQPVVEVTVRDKVGPLEDNAEIKITQGCLMTEELNMRFSSVFTREDTSSLPVPETKFNGSEEERLGQLIVTQEVVAW